MKEIVIYLKLVTVSYDIASEDCFYVLHLQRHFMKYLNATEEINTE